jgi:hypothetical protein
MPNKYWIGGAATTSWNINANWSLSSGGTANTTAPTTADDAYFDAASGSGIVIITSGAAAARIFFTNITTGSYSGTLRMTNGLQVSFDFTLSATMSIDGAGTLTKASSGGTLTSNGKIWPNSIQTPNGNGFATTFGDSWTILGSLVGTANPVQILASAPTKTITIGGSLASGAAYNCNSGNIAFVMNGSGSLSGSFTNCSITINTTGAITQPSPGLGFSQGVTYNIDAVGTYTSTGGISIGSNGVIFGGTALSGVSIQSLSFGAGASQVLTLNAPTNIGNLVVNGSASGTINGSTLSVSNSIVPLNGIFGTSTIEMTGSSSATVSGGSMQNNFTINKSGGAVVIFASTFTWGLANRSLTINSLVNFSNNSNTFTLSGTPLTINNSSASQFFNMTVPANITLNINGSTIPINGTLALSGSTTFAGAFGWTCGSLTCTTASSIIIILQAGNTYITTTNVNMVGTNAGRITMRSNTPTVLPRAIWTLQNPATQSMVYVNGQGIDSNAGSTIWSFGGTISTALIPLNWNLGSKPATKSFTFVC